MDTFNQCLVGAFYVIVKLQTSRRFVSSSNHHSHSHRGILYTLPSHVGPELCVRSQKSEAGQSVGWWRTCNYHNCYNLGSQSRGIMNHSANKVMRLTPSLALAGGCTWLGLHTAEVPSRLVPQIDPSVPQPVVQSRRRPLLGPPPG